MNNNSQQTDNTELILPDHDPGYFYNPTVVAGQHGAIELSPRVAAHCKCGGESPFLIMDNTATEPIPCPCRPYRLKISHINKFIRASGMPERFKFKFLEYFQLEDQRGQPIPGAEKIKHKLQTLINQVENYRKESQSKNKPKSDTLLNTPPKTPLPKGLFLWGKPGNGKTLLSCIVLNELINRTSSAGRFIGISRNFFQTLRHTFDDDSPIHGQAIPIMETLSRVPFLVIDDFGVQRNSEFEVEMLYNLIDARYADQRLTIVTTNESLEEIKELAQGRIYSRFHEMCQIINITFPDYRLHLKEEDII